MLNKGINLLLFCCLIISFLFLAYEHEGFAGVAIIDTDCCQISENECADTSEGPILCMEGDLQENAFCDENLGLCRTELTPIRGRPIPTLSEWGLIAMGGVLGIVALLILRRRRAAA